MNTILVTIQEVDSSSVAIISNNNTTVEIQTQDKVTVTIDN